MPREKTILKKKPTVKKKTKITKEIKKEEVKKIRKEPFILAVGKRKSAVAQIQLQPIGHGKISINQKDLKNYFPYFEWQKIVLSPLEVTQSQNIDLSIKVQGGGTKAQTESIRLGIARALIKLNPDFRVVLKKYGYLTRDSRIKERKKPGLKRARRAPQWQKR